MLDGKARVRLGSALGYMMREGLGCGKTPPQRAVAAAMRSESSASAPLMPAA
jgi:hypothetical protein